MPEKSKHYRVKNSEGQCVGGVYDDLRDATNVMGLNDNWYVTGFYFERGFDGRQRLVSVNIEAMNETGGN